MASNRKVLLFTEVEKHNKMKDCWVIVNGKVYDVTPFTDDHPGGDEVLLSATGKDATKEFDNTGHSDEAIQMMDKFYIGDIDPSTIPERGTYIPPHEAPSRDSNTHEIIKEILRFLVPLFILGLAFASRNFSMKA